MRWPFSLNRLISGHAFAESAAAGFESGLPSSVAVPVQSELVEVRAQLLKRVRSGDIPSLAIGVVRGEEVVWAEGLGWANREERLPATVETLYPVASVSKSITATGALALAGDGKLNLDQEAAELLGDEYLPGPVAGLQIAQLMAHTSGIPHLWYYTYADRPKTTLSRGEMIRKYAITVAPPGERYIYSNLGYGVLAEVIETASGQGFQDVMQQMLFKPLGMARTTVEAWVGQAGTARGYNGEGKPILYPFRLAPDGGAGFFSNVTDLVRYVQFHLGALQGVDLLRTSASVTANLSPEGFYHQGWGVVRMKDISLLVSDGDMLGGTAAVVIVPERDIAVVILCNATGGPAVESAVMVLTSLIPGFDLAFGAAVESIESEISKPGAMPGGRFEGFYDDRGRPVGMTLDFSVPEQPILQLDRFAAPLQELGWERSALTATVVGTLPVGAAKGQAHRLVLTLWSVGDELHGVAQEEWTEDRPQFGIPHRISLAPVR